MLLRRLISSLDPDQVSIVDVLDKAGIKTTENLIFTAPSTILSHIPDSDVELWQLETLIERCIRLTAPQSCTGADELQNEEDRGRKVDFHAWGVGAMDELLGAWDGVGVLEVAGPQRTGKSLLLLHMALRHLVENANHTVRWLDTDGSFSVSRAQAILGAWAMEDADAILGRLFLSPCYSGDDVINMLQRIRDEDVDARTTRFLVIDSITPLLRDTLMGSGSQGHATMVALLEELSEIAYERDIGILVSNATVSARPTNAMSTFTATDVKPALGTDFTYFSDISLLVQSTGKVFGEIDEGERDRQFGAPGLRGVVEVLKNRVGPAGRWAVFETDGKTLMDVVPAPDDDERTIQMTAGHIAGERPAFGALSETLAQSYR